MYYSNKTKRSKLFYMQIKKNNQRVFKKKN